MNTSIAQQQLTENIIKKVALRFLRQYYKFRLRYEDQPVTAKYDLEGVGGIIADGYYSFKKTDGRLFTATFEATGRESKDEVIFKPQLRTLFWDGVAVASIATLGISTFNYFFDLHLLDERTVLMRIGLMLLSMILSWTIFFIIAKNFRRYRYIYAVEQFKKYHADEQWIALAEDVFENSNDKHYRELQYQCVHNGFGLLQVSQNLDTKILVTPSRQDIFLGKRREVEFMPSKIVQQQTAQKKFNAAWAIFGSWLPDFLKSDDSLLRFRKSYNSQLGISALCILLVGFLFMKEMSLSGYQYVDQTEFRHSIARSQSNEVKEQPEVLGDSLLPDNSPNHKLEELNSKLWKPKKPTSIIKPATTPSSNTPTIKEPKIERIIPDDTEEIVVNQNSGKPIPYDCSRFFTFDTYKYIVQEGEYKAWNPAERRLALIRNSNIPSAALLKNCFFPGESGFMIYLGEIFNSPEEASTYIEELNASTQTVVRNVRKLEIVKLRPPAGR